MVNILEGRIVWTGFPGAPGYNILHASASGLLSTAVNNFVSGLDALAGALSALTTSAMHLQAEQVVKQLDPATGDLISLETASTATTAWSGAFSALGGGASGAVIGWKTTGVNRGRVVRGRTFVVPIARDEYDPDGTLLAGAITALNTAATNYRTSAAYESVVWSRPRAGAGGAAFPITAHQVRDKAAILRSRRD